MRLGLWLAVGLMSVGASAWAVDATKPTSDEPPYGDAKEAVGSDAEGRDVGAGIGSCNYAGKTEKLSPVECAVRGGLWHARSLDSSVQGKSHKEPTLAH
jgi:hypothetical protein